MHEKTVVLRQYRQQIHADVARSALDARGIAALVQPGPGHHATLTYDVIVREEDAEAADALLGHEETFSD